MKLSHLLNRTSNLAFWSSLFQNCNHLSKQNGMSERMHVYLIYFFRLTLPESTAMFSMIWSSLQLMDHARAEEAKRQHQEDKSDQLEVILSFEFDFAFNFAMNRDTFYSRSKNIMVLFFEFLFVPLFTWITQLWKFKTGFKLRDFIMCRNQIFKLIYHEVWTVDCLIFLRYLMH